MVQKERDYNIDLLKIFACVAVVGLHTFKKDLSPIDSTLYYLCGFAIPVFMMSSGALLLNRGQITWHYIFLKQMKILRTALLWNLLVACAIYGYHYLFKSDASIGMFLTFPEDVANSLLQRGFLFHFWYFTALMILYLLLPCLAKMSVCHKGGGNYNHWNNMCNTAGVVYERGLSYTK